MLTLAACGRGMVSFEERPAWRAEAEQSCLKSGAVKVSTAVAQMDPISGPGMCGAEFPLKVAALGSMNSAVGYADDLRPPGAIPSGAQPRWPIARAPANSPPPGGYGSQVLQAPGGGNAVISSSGEPMVIAPPRGNSNFPEYGSVPPPSARPGYAPANAPFGAQPVRAAPPPELDPEEEDDVPDDAIRPGQGSAPATRPAYTPPPAASPRVPQIPQLGPPKGLYTGSATPVAVTPAATLACPIVSALDQWVSNTVQPAAHRWFGQPVVEIKQISAYSCRGMNGQIGARISEHAFGNALDIAAFVLADGRKVTVKKNWNGAPDEQAFLHDVQGGACETFTTVLAPGSNKYHYDHIHVDLMRRASRRLICQPAAIDGRVAFARAQSRYAGRGAADPGITGSIKQLVEKYAIAGEDGVFDDDDEPSLPKKRVSHQTSK